MCNLKSDKQFFCYEFYTMNSEAILNIASDDDEIYLFYRFWENFSKCIRIFTNK